MIFLDNKMQELEVNSIPGTSLNAHISYNGAEYYTTIDDKYKNITEELLNQDSNRASNE